MVVSASVNNDNVTYEGNIPGNTVARRVARSRVFVLPSLNEPWGNVLVTALSIGIPVVVTRSAALAHEIQDGGVGIVVPDCDGVAIANAVHEVISLAESDYDELATRCREFASKRFGNSDVSAKLEQIYREALAISAKLESAG